MFLTERFQQFYLEVLRLKSRVMEGSWVFPIVTTAGAVDPLSTDSPTAAWRQLHALLERQTLDAAREGGDFAVEIYRRAQYAMAALADEIFLNLQWSGRTAWRDHLLEDKLFGTRRAGEEIFNRIEEVLRDREAVYGELARIYLTVLALGFQGKFRGEPDGEQAIDSYRHRLHRFIFGRDPQAGRGIEHVTVQAYGATLDEARKTELPYLKPWIWVMVVIVLVWVGAAHVVWHYATRDLKPLVSEIAQGGRAGSTAQGDR
jgi:type VI secretion system protein ImpK